MTIFQKMLAVPVLALFLYAGFLFYSFNQYQQMTDKVATLREQYLPLLDIVNDNAYLFNQIRSNFKDAVLADEPLWLPNTAQHKQTIEKNLQRLLQHGDLVDAKAVSTLQQSFNQYYGNAERLATSMLNDQDSVIADDILVQNVGRYHNEAQEHFTELKLSINNSFRQMLDDTSQVMNRLLLVGSVMSMVIVVIILTVTVLVSVSTRRSVYQVITRMRSFALGSTDFSRRLQRKNKDELGYLIYWFDKLSDKLEQDYKVLETVSITDALTQLNNRCRTDVYLPQALAQAQQQQQQIALIMLDIDHFKAINDNYGHLVGDAVLTHFASILKQQAREHDFLARWGGEEFILILPDADYASAREYAEQLRRKVLQHEFDTVGHLSASFGIAISQPLDKAITLVKKADDCLYEAKKRGRNCVVTAQELQL